MELGGRVAVVTGGASGIGRALCHALADADARVVVADLDGAGAAEVAKATGGVPVEADVSLSAQVQTLVETAEKRLGPIDIVCSNAGIALGGGPEAADQDWQRSWQVNVMAHVYLARAVVPRMLARGGGHLIGTVSAAALLNHINAAPYAATKAAALSLFEWLAIAHGDSGLRVSVVCPQGVRTPMLEADESSFLLPEAVEPEDVARTVLDAMGDGRFLILPHEQVLEYVQRKADDYDRWIRGMRRLRARHATGPPA